MRKIVGIVQARMHSSRLPNKVMLWLNGEPIIDWVVQRTMKTTKLDEVVVAIPNTPYDDVLFTHLKRSGYKVYRGSEEDVVSRYYEAAIAYNATDIVRICADRPLICASEIDLLVEYYIKSGADYSYNHLPINNKYPIGLGAEICSLKVLEQIYHNATTSEHREHLFNYLLKNKKKYSISTFDPPVLSMRHPDLKYDIDTYEDYDKLLRGGYKIDMTALDIVSKVL